MGKLWTELDTCAPSASPTEKPTNGPTSAPTTAEPTPSPTMSPTPSPTSVTTVTVRGNKFKLSFGGRLFGRGDAVGGQLFGGSRRHLQGDVRTLQDQAASQENCLSEEELAYVESRLESNAMKQYENLSGPVAVQSIDITITDHEDTSPNGDCSEVNFTYDQDMTYTEAGEDYDLKEIVEYPLGDAGGREEFVQDLQGGSEGEGVFADVSDAGGVTVTQQGLKTRMPTSSPSVSVQPTASPTVSPSG